MRHNEIRVWSKNLPRIWGEMKKTQTKLCLFVSKDVSIYLHTKQVSKSVINKRVVSEIVGSMQNENKNSKSVSLCMQFIFLDTLNFLNYYFIITLQKFSTKMVQQY